ncbi:hypothetical protein EGW08_014312, partial [Elysia chlorotica]
AVLVTEPPTPRPTIQGEEGLCACGCTDNATTTPSTSTERRKYLDKRQREVWRTLHLDMKALSTRMRRRTSAEDGRRSAQSVGYAGVIMLALMFGSVLISDVTSLWLNSKRKKKYTPTSKRHCANESHRQV